MSSGNKNRFKLPIALEEKSNITTSEYETTHSARERALNDAYTFASNRANINDYRRANKNGDKPDLTGDPMKDV